MNIKNVVIVILVVLLAVAVGGSVYFYRKSHEVSNSSEISKEETLALVVKVGKLIVLPEGEVPTVATVSDPEKLRSQAFFANAKSGDKVLLYPGAKKAYLYDPEANKLVEVAPISSQSPANTNAPTPTPTSAPVNSGNKTASTTSQKR